MATKEFFFKSYGKDRKGSRWCKKVDGNPQLSPSAIQAFIRSSA